MLFGQHALRRWLQHTRPHTQLIPHNLSNAARIQCLGATAQANTPVHNLGGAPPHTTAFMRTHTHKLQVAAHAPRHRHICSPHSPKVAAQRIFNVLLRGRLLRRAQQRVHGHHKPWSRQGHKPKALPVNECGAQQACQSTSQKRSQAKSAALRRHALRCCSQCRLSRVTQFKSS